MICNLVENWLTASPCVRDPVGQLPVISANSRRHPSPPAIYAAPLAPPTASQRAAQQHAGNPMSDPAGQPMPPPTLAAFAHFPNGSETLARCARRGRWPRHSLAPRCLVGAAPAELAQRVADLKVELGAAQQLATARWNDQLAAIKQQLQHRPGPSSSCGTGASRAC